MTEPGCFKSSYQASFSVLITDYNHNTAIDFINLVVIIAKKILKNVKDYEQVISDPQNRIEIILLMVTVFTSQNAFRKQNQVASDSPKEVPHGNSYGMKGRRSYWGPPVPADLWSPGHTCSIIDGSFSKKVGISSGFNVIRPISSSFQRQLRPKINIHDHGFCL